MKRTKSKKDKWIKNVDLAVLSDEFDFNNQKSDLFRDLVCKEIRMERELLKILER